MTRFHATANGPVPFTAEENAAWDAEEAALAAEQAINGYKSKRSAEYPDFKEYLDGIVKGDQTQIQSYIDACLAVKAKYPKP